MNIIMINNNEFFLLHFINALLIFIIHYQVWNDDFFDYVYSFHYYKFHVWCTLKLLDKFNCEFKSENIVRIKNWEVILGLQHFKGKRVCCSFGMGTKMSDK